MIAFPAGVKVRVAGGVTDMRCGMNSLERDSQMESILANRKRDLGISSITSNRLGRELAFSHGLELGRSRGLGL